MCYNELSTTNKGIKMETTRKFSRTLDEAFPKTVNYASSITSYKRLQYEKLADVMLAVSIGISLAYAAMEYFL